VIHELLFPLTISLSLSKPHFVNVASRLSHSIFIFSLFLPDFHFLQKSDNFRLFVCFLGFGACGADTGNRVHQEEPGRQRPTVLIFVLVSALYNLSFSAIILWQGSRQNKLSRTILRRWELLFIKFTRAVTAYTMFYTLSLH
jgi:hypothetical protein